MKVHNTICCNFSFPVDQQHVEECPGIKHCVPALKGTKMKKNSYPTTVLPWPRLLMVALPLADFPLQDFYKLSHSHSPQ